MSKHDRSSRGREYRDRSRDRYEKSRDRYERSDRDREVPTTRRSRRHRSPSYDSYESDSDSYSSDSSREPSPRRPSRRHTTAYSDGEEKAHKSRGREHRRREREYYSEESPSRERKGKTAMVEDLLAAVGLMQSKGKDSRGHDRRDRSEAHGEGKGTQARDAIQAALTAAAMEAWRTRKEGKLTPQRLMQIAGAAIAAGGLDAVVDRSGGNGGSLKTIVESVVAGLATGKTLGGNIKHKREDSMGGKVGGGVVGMAAKHLARSLSQGPKRRGTTKY